MFASDGSRIAFLIIFLVFASVGNSTTVATTAVESARYIKGDPLNGYYDFVISEGSYKFWAVFQVIYCSGPDFVTRTPSSSKITPHLFPIAGGYSCAHHLFYLRRHLLLQSEPPDVRL